MFVDTGPIVAYWVESDQDHDRAVALWTRAFEENRRFATTAMVLTEASLLVSRCGDPDVAHRMLTAVLTSPRWNVADVPNAELLEATARVGEPLGGSGLSWTDAVSFVVIRNAPREPVLTFDRRHFGAEGLAIYGDE